MRWEPQRGCSLARRTIGCWELLVQRRPAGLAMRGGPRPGHEPPVPTQQRLGRDEEARPAGPGEHPADRGEQGPVAGPECGSCALPAEHGELVTQDEDLQVLGGVPAGEQRQQLDGAAQREVGEVRQDQVSSAVGAEAPPYQPLRPGTPAHGSRPSLRTPQDVVAIGRTPH
jgi:hypothetical protein